MGEDVTHRHKKSTAEKERGIPAIYYTNNISARPLFFAAGAATVLGMIGGLLGRKAVFEKMKEYFT